jgi:hypothetical protein
MEEDGCQHISEFPVYEDREFSETLHFEISRLVALEILRTLVSEKNSSLFILEDKYPAVVIILWLYPLLMKGKDKSSINRTKLKASKRLRTTYTKTFHRCAKFYNRYTERSCPMNCKLCTPSHII